MRQWSAHVALHLAVLHFDGAKCNKGMEKIQMTLVMWVVRFRLMTSMSQSVDDADADDKK